MVYAPAKRKQQILFKQNICANAKRKRKKIKIPIKWRMIFRFSFSSGTGIPIWFIMQIRWRRIGCLCKRYNEKEKTEDFFYFYFVFHFYQVKKSTKQIFYDCKFLIMCWKLSCSTQFILPRMRSLFLFPLLELKRRFSTNDVQQFPFFFILSRSLSLSLSFFYFHLDWMLQVLLLFRSATKQFYLSDDNE